MSSLGSKSGDPPTMEDKYLQPYCRPAEAAKQSASLPSIIIQEPSPRDIQGPSRRVTPHPAPIPQRKLNREDRFKVNPFHTTRSPIMSRGLDPRFWGVQCRNPECNLHRWGSWDYIPPSKCTNFPPSTSANHIEWAWEARTVRVKGPDLEKVDVSLVDKLEAWFKCKVAKMRYKNMKKGDKLLPKRNFLKVCEEEEGKCRDEHCLKHDPSGELGMYKPFFSRKGKGRAIYYDDDDGTVVTTAYLGTSPRHSSESESKPAELPLLSLREAAERESRAEKLAFRRAKYESAKQHRYHLQVIEAKKNKRKRAVKREKWVLNKEIRLTRQAKKMAEIKLRRVEGDSDAGKCDEEEWKKIVEATTQAKDAAKQRLKAFDPVYAERRRGNLAVKAFYGLALARCRLKANIPKIFTNAPHLRVEDFDAYLVYHHMGTSFRPVFHKEEQKAREYALWVHRRAEMRRGRELGRELVWEERAEERKRFVRERWERNRRRREGVKGVKGAGKCVRFVEGERVQEEEEEVKEGEDDELGEDYFDLKYQDEDISRVQQQRRARVGGRQGHAQRMELLDFPGPEAMAEEMELRDCISRNRKRDAELREEETMKVRSSTKGQEGNHASSHEGIVQGATYHRPPTPFQHSTQPTRPRLQTQPSSFPSIYPSPVFSEPPPGPRHFSCETVVSNAEADDEDEGGAKETNAEEGDAIDDEEDGERLTPEQINGLVRYRQLMIDMHRKPREGLERDSWGNVIEMAREEEDYFVESHGRRGEDPE